MNLTDEGMKPIQQDEAPEFQLREQRAVSAPSESVAVSSGMSSRALSTFVEDVFHTKIQPQDVSAALQVSLSPPALPPTPSDSNGGDSSLSAEVASLRAELTAMRAILGNAPSTTPSSSDSDTAPEAKAPTQTETDTATAAAKLGTDKTNEGKAEATGGTAADFSAREAAAGLNLAGNDTTSGRGELGPTFSQREAAAGLNLGGNSTTSGRDEVAVPDEVEGSDKEEAKKPEEVSEEDPEAKENLETRTCNDSALPIASERQGRIYIPGIDEFNVYAKITDNSSFSGLSLKVTVNDLAVGTASFVDEFDPGSLEDMVTFSSDNQNEFTMPLAQREGGTWIVMAEGGIYITPIYCVNGKPAIFPTRVS